MIMKTYYKRYLIEPCEGLAYIPNAPKLQVINLDDCDESIFTCNTLEEAKTYIDEKEA